MKIYLTIKTNYGKKSHRAMHLPQEAFKDRPTLANHLRDKLGTRIDYVKIKGQVPQWAQMIFL